MFPQWNRNGFHRWKPCIKSYIYCLVFGVILILLWNMKHRQIGSDYAKINPEIKAKVRCCLLHILMYVHKTEATFFCVARRKWKKGSQFIQCSTVCEILHFFASISNICYHRFSNFSCMFLNPNNFFQFEL